MAKPPDQSMSLFSALASAAATAYSLAYMAHSEWGISRTRIREDALVLAALLGVALTVNIVLQRKKNKRS
jgi:formate hydrogenlyase subunit 3/multisubunit Na+/H+ antiporter MnhD subunit